MQILSVSNSKENKNIYDSKEFLELVYKRIEIALTENKEYMEMESECVKLSHNRNSEEYENINSIIGAKAEEICYIKGYKDALAMVIGINN